MPVSHVRRNTGKSMPPLRPKAEQLPQAVKQWLDATLVDGNFSGYEAIAGELKTRGYAISKSALHSYGQKFEDNLKRLKLATEQARAVVAATPDDDGALNEAMMRLTQEKTFQILQDLNIDAETIDPIKLMRAVAELGKASVAQKKWQVEARRIALTEAATVAGKEARASGLDDAAADRIANRILGIAV